MTALLGRLWGARAVRKLRRDPVALACLAVIAAYATTALLVGLGAIATGFDERVGAKYLAPSPRFLLGTDRQGRDIFVRVVHATKIAFQVGLASSAIGAAAGALLGAAAGYFGRKVDAAVVWLYSTIESIPYLLLLIALTYVAGRGLGGIYVAFCTTFWTGPCRIVRGEVLRLREAEYVQAARALGYGPGRILLRHVLPNTSHLILVQFALLFVSAIKAEVILSYLGLGVQGEPSWGTMIDQARSELINGFYWQIGAATVAMFVLVLCFNVFADALQDALDPRKV